MIENVSVLFLSGNTTYSKIIEFFTGSTTIHVAICAGAMCYHSDVPGGVQEVPTYLLLKKYKVEHEKPLGEVDTSYVRSHLGKPYDYLSIPLAFIGQLFGKKLCGGDRAYICTEFVSKILWGVPYALSPVMLYSAIVLDKNPVKKELV